ncbi:putative glucose-methanol-choline oxidoreductase protein [Neofusicoccum parvum]|nr:putative glucose-methanol-choline oxidoreductase protein [Neofusicoccum parvum]
MELNCHMPEYDVVVIGSGYGGGVAASRAARAGKSVAILELGKEKWPGEYPANLAEAAMEIHASGNLNPDTRSGKIWDLALGLTGPTGLYHLIVGEGQNAFVANGLGGTSLLNANVFLECDKRTLQLPSWPKDVRSNPDDLDEYYDRARTMLQPTEYPESYPPLEKLSVLQKQAKALYQEQNFKRVPQTTFFHNGLNNAGVMMKASTGSGQDCTGVNDGSKNSVLMNYLPDAWNHGAEIFCECEVRYIREDPSGNGYIIFYAWHGDGRAAFKNAIYSDLMWVRAKEVCFLGAGSIGSTEILLRSQRQGLTMSDYVGTKMSGNGDILAFGYNTDECVNSIGSEKPRSHPAGPTITGVIDNRDEKTSPNVLDGHVIEEGAIPESLAAVFQYMLEGSPDKIFPSKWGIIEQLRHFASRTQARLPFVGPYLPGSSVNRTQTYLIMSHDSNEANLSLENDKPYLEFLGVGRTRHVKKLNETLARATNAIGGTMINSPFYTYFGQKEITVHPLGGAIMARDNNGDTGATNSFGQVFKDKTGDGVYEGLVVVDGAIVPTALGVNPFATITALAERSLQYIATKRGWGDVQELIKEQNGPLDLFGKPKKSYAMTPDMKKTERLIKSSSADSGVRFTEIMEGHMHIGGDIDDFQTAERVARGRSSAARFYLSVDAFSVRDLVQCVDHAAVATGTFSCAALSKDPLLVLRGTVNFFTPDAAISDGTNFVYNLTLLSTEGKEYNLHGFKKVGSDMAYSVSKTWHATTSLYTTITHNDEVVGRGMLYISFSDFASELLSFQPTSRRLLDKLLGTAGFLSFFTKNTAQYFLGQLRKLEFPGDTAYSGSSSKPQSSDIHITARDGVKLVMKVWRSPNRVPTRAPVLMVPGASVDEQIYSLPTIKQNAVEYFLDQGMDVYVIVLRVGRTPTAEQGWTGYDARLDVQAAMEAIYKEHKTKMYIVCHCLGSVATSMGLLDGSLPTEQIQGVCASQVFFAHRFGGVNRVKAATSLLPKLYRLLARTAWFPVATPGSVLSAWPFQFLMDQVLRFYPVGESNELCNSTVCHRSSLAFGRLWNHDNLNRATHSRLANFVGGIHMKALSHLMRMGREGFAIDNHGNSLVTDKNLSRLEGVPILFISSGQNVVYDPECTNTSYDMLREKFGTELYQRRVVPGYGHLDSWMGKDSYKDVYPIVNKHMKWCERGVSKKKVGK